MRGRIPKPTEVKKRNGNPGKRPLPQHEPKFVVGAEVPAWLGDGARAVWAELAPRYEKVGLLKDGDSEAFGQLCELMAEFRKSPVDFPTSRGRWMDALMQRFGMDPASRTRIDVPPATPGDDETRFFGIA